ncbi:CsbD family protein [Pseudorhizobium pelagicum]|nr:CsbD family protein [Pseudorhizobium pelagicum]
MGSTSDKISGKANELTGQAKQAVGDATDNHSMERKGAAQQAKNVVDKS